MTSINVDKGQHWQENVNYTIKKGHIDSVVWHSNTHLKYTTFMVDRVDSYGNGWIGNSYFTRYECQYFNLEGNDETENDSTAKEKILNVLSFLWQLLQEFVK